jgi:mono/diheme cytochrome c family protein
LKIWFLPGLVLVLAAAQSQAGTGEAVISPFVREYCADCHDGETKKGGLDLTALQLDLQNPQTFASWVLVHDRVSAGEMPPKKRARPKPADLAAFVKTLTSSLVTAEGRQLGPEGRATQRRMNRYEYEDTLRDLLSLPDLEVKAFLPEDSEACGFNKVGDALDVSHVQIARYLSAADFALHEAMAPQAEPPEKKITRYYSWDQGGLYGHIHLEGPLNRRTFPLVGLELQTAIMAEKVSEKSPKKAPMDRDPTHRPQEAMAVVVSTYEPTEIQFDGFRAPVSGTYKLTFSAYSINMGLKFTNVTAGRRPEPVTIYADTEPRLLRKLGSFDVDAQPTVREMTVWLQAGETIRPDAARLFRSRPPDFKNPLAGPEGMPGLAFQWMEVEGPIFEQWPPAGQQLLFGNLPMVNRPGPRKKKNFVKPAGVEVVSKNPERDAKDLLRGFLRQAYRRPVQESDVERFAAVVDHAMKTGSSFTDAMIVGYTAVLSSPAFLYLHEKPGRLDDLALAERLSYFLWNSSPDQELRKLADKRELHQPKILGQQTERLLNDPRSLRFVHAFLDYWLDLRHINDTDADAELYPDYQLDDLLVESMVGETEGFFDELIRRNLGVSNLVASDFAMLNERLAALYGIPGVEGVELRPVPLPKDSVRGGLLTQASVLKITSNGTTTSPVKRGAWVMARLLGKPPPPPPANVPALDPDTRGATTIREQLAKHRNQESCAACHRNIDPAGFALESFDVMGGFRDHYRSTGAGEPVKGIGHNSLTFHFCLGPDVDPSGALPDGRKFGDVRELKTELLADQEQLARNMVQQLTVYATGAPIRFSDRPQIARILAQSKETGYGIRTLIHQVVQSDLFLNK